MLSFVVCCNLTEISSTCFDGVSLNWHWGFDKHSKAWRRSVERCYNVIRFDDVLSMACSRNTFGYDIYFFSTFHVRWWSGMKHLRNANGILQYVRWRKHNYLTHFCFEPIGNATNIPCDMASLTWRCLLVWCFRVNTMFIWQRLFLNSVDMSPIFFEVVNDLGAVFE